MLVPAPRAIADRGFPEGGPVPTSAAATIVLLRQAAIGLETFVMRRHSKMRFAPGQYVFPGGQVSQGDYADIEWAGPSEEYWADRFNCSPDLARALVVAAVRETYEETGVLLAGQDSGSFVSEAELSGITDARAALEAESLTLAEFLAANSWVLRADALSAWANWITPNFQPRRFDTRFFVAGIPAEQQVQGVSGEADLVQWSLVSDLVDAHQRGEIEMLPPTSATCRELATLTLADVPGVAAKRTISAIEPRLVQVDGKLFIEIDDATQL